MQKRRRAELRDEMRGGGSSASETVDVEFLLRPECFFESLSFPTIDKTLPDEGI